MRKFVYYVCTHPMAIISYISRYSIDGYNRQVKADLKYICKKICQNYFYFM